MGVSETQEISQHWEIAALTCVELILSWVSVCVCVTVQRVWTVFGLWFWRGRINSVNLMLWGEALWHLNLSRREGWFCVCPSVCVRDGAAGVKVLEGDLLKMLEMSLLFTLLRFEKVTLSLSLSPSSSLSVCLSTSQISCLESGCCRLGDTSCLISLGWKRCPQRTVTSSWHLQVRHSQTLKCLYFYLYYSTPKVNFNYINSMPKVSTYPHLNLSAAKLFWLSMNLLSIKNCQKKVRLNFPDIFRLFILSD